MIEHGQCTGLIPDYHVLTLAGAGGDIGQGGLVGPVCRSAFQHKPAVAIAAIDIAMLVYFQIDTRMPQRGGLVRSVPRSRAANGAGPVTTDAGLVDENGFWRRNMHGARR